MNGNHLLDVQPEAIDRVRAAVPVPEPSNLSDFVADADAARALGKALFWDMQVGSDGVQACASCHFRAGADPRSKNQVSPGLRHAPFPDLGYSNRTGPNYQLKASDFPLTRLANPSPQSDSMPELAPTTIRELASTRVLEAIGRAQRFPNQLRPVSRTAAPGHARGMSTPESAAG
jgi:hypothetical protein